MSELQTTKITDRAGTGSPNFSQGLKISGTDSGLLAPTRTEGETQPDAETSSNGDTFYDTVNETYDILIEGAWVRVLGAGGGAVSWTVDLSNVTYDSVSFSIISQLSNAEGIAFSNDGSKIFLTGRTSDSIYQYSLSTAFDLSTASYDSVSLSVSGQDGTPTSLRFNSDGTKMFLIGRSNDSAYQFSLSTAFDLSTASYDSVSFSFATQQTQPQALAFNADGTKMYIGGNDSSSIFQYSLSTGFDISTASYDSVSFSVSSQEASGPTGIYFSTEGTKMYICGPGTDSVYQYTLSTGFDLSTASYDSVSFLLTGGVTYPTDLTFSANGTKMYIVDSGSDAIKQYSTGL